jgi:hypothetical protein
MIQLHVVAVVALEVLAAMEHQVQGAVRVV